MAAMTKRKNECEDGDVDQTIMLRKKERKEEEKKKDPLTNRDVYC